MTRFDQSNSSHRSRAGTPSTSARLSSGISAATSLAKSHSPLLPPLSMPSTIARACPAICSSSADTARGVKERDSIRRSRECSGGSMLSIIRRT